MAANKKVGLTAKWQLDAALLSRPVDLTALVSMSRSTPDKFVENGDTTLTRLVTMLLNEKNLTKADKDTKLDVLNILANVAAGSKKAVAEVRVALGGVSEWFDEYIAGEESDPGEGPELHKGMVLLLARCWEYRLKTEDVLELCQGNRRIALCTVVGILEDGETYSTELKQRQRPGQGKMGQWEHELVCQRYEKPLILQMCRLLRGFTHPGTYFEASTEELALFSVEKFAEEMDGLLDITLRSRLVEKMAMALFDCLFEDFGEKRNNGSGNRRRKNRTGNEQKDSLGASTGNPPNEGKEQDHHDDDDDDDDIDGMMLEESDHMAVVSVHAFLQNLYFYASENNEEFRRHMLVETLLIPRLVLPYLDRCVLHATILNSRAEMYSEMLEGDRIAEMALHNPQLVKGIAASLRTLIISSFRAPSTQFVMALLKRLNPTAQILRARSFCRHHEYIFALLCLLNVNMSALDLSQRAEVDADGDDNYSLYDGHHAHTLLHELATVYSSMDSTIQARVQKRVMFSGALPISRDTPSYAAIMSILNGGEAGQLDYARKQRRKSDDGEEDAKDDDDDWLASSRAEAKSGVSSSRAHSNRAPYHAGGKGVDDSYNNNHSTDDQENHYRSSSQQQSIVSEAKELQKRLHNNFNNHHHDDDVNLDNDNKDHDHDSKGGNNSNYRLLGDLPSLSGNQHRGSHSMNYREREMIDKDVKVALNLELPQQQAGMRLGQGMMAAAAGGTNNNNSSGQRASSGNKLNTHTDSGDGHEGGHTNNSHHPRNHQSDGSVPTEFLCAINGHVMKAPLRNRESGLVFEKATIELWLTSRGSVCPITGNTLTREDLVPDDELRNRIKRYHIQQTSRRAAPMAEDDLYDF